MVESSIVYWISQNPDMEFVKKFYTAGFSGQKFYTVNFT